MAHRGKLWKIFGSEQFLRCMWCILQSKKHGYWRLQRRKIKKEYRVNGKISMQRSLEQAKRSANTDCNAQIMRLVFECNESWKLGKL